MKKSGPNTEPCGTPWQTAELSHLQFYIWMNFILSVRFKANHLYNARDSNASQMFHEKLVSNNIRGATEMKEDEDGD